MQFDGGINVATGLAYNSKKWKNRKVRWSYMVKKLSTPVRTSELFNEYLAATKEEKRKLKDVGGYVGAYLRGGRRKKENVVSRQLITLDLDYAHLDFWEDFTLQFGNAALLHSTHSHSKKKPRYRLIMPMSREVSPDEYVAISRKIASIVDIELFDDTTFETHRLMFWASAAKDGDFEAQSQDGNWLDPDTVLGMYQDWTDCSQWAISSRRTKDVNRLNKKQEDPETKKGIVGAFCRAYDIDEAIAVFLPEEYIDAGEECRYTYTKGSTAAGVVTYEGKFSFSHHGTDPCSGKLCNAFDLVRLHRFSDLDTGDIADPKRQKSYRAMEDLARADKKVLGVIAEEQIGGAKYDFKEDYVAVEVSPEDKEALLLWATELDVDTKGRYLSSANNLNLIFANDSRLKGIFRYNTFDFKRYLFSSMPWRKITKPETIRNVDYAGVRNYIESIYAIVGNSKVEDALALEFEKNSFNPVLDYLEAQVWDGVERVDRILIDYLGAEDNLYTRQAMRKTLVGAVTRIYAPGAKFDLVLTLVGEQGTGKSTLAKKLGGSWFSDTFTTVQGTRAFEQLHGAWVIEMAELAGLRKAEVESIKHFISKQEDMFRPAYGKAVEVYKRQCIFIGTTNNKDFLTDPTGNRRFMPVDIRASKATKSVWDMDAKEVACIWAEAVAMYKKGETCYLEDEALKQARIEQKKHSKADEREGIIEQYLNTLLPKTWQELDISDRINFLTDELSPEGTEEREYVCVFELWCECLGKDKRDMDRYKTRDIHEIMRGLEGWERSNSTKNFKIYGKQKYYARKK